MHIRQAEVEKAKKKEKRTAYYLVLLLTEKLYYRTFY
jgi:hypothetical protein